jgi:predicted phosphodiesterase
VKLHILSDLHNEFAPHQPNPTAAAAADVIVLAGDIDLGTKGLTWARDAFPNHEIVYVAGNHEFYRHHWNQLLVDMRLKAETLGIHFLENQAATIGGVRFLGTTLWTDYDFFGRNKRQAYMREAEEKLNDFRLIKAQTIQPERVSAIMGTADGKKGPVRWSRKLTAVHTLERHQKSLMWLQDELLKGDPEKTVVVTHHYPHMNSCAPRWVDEPLTAIFGSNLSDKVLLRAGLWIHGHTHDSCDYLLGDSTRSVRVICNPKGYPLDRLNNEFENGSFDPGMLVEV